MLEPAPPMSIELSEKKLRVFRKKNHKDSQALLTMYIQLGILGHHETKTLTKRKNEMTTHEANRIVEWPIQAPRTVGPDIRLIIRILYTFCFLDRRVGQLTRRKYAAELESAKQTLQQDFPVAVELRNKKKNNHS